MVSCLAAIIPAAGASKAWPAPSRKPGMTGAGRPAEARATAAFTARLAGSPAR